MDYIVVEKWALECPICGTTSRANFHNVSTVEQSGTFKGKRYSHIRRAKTACAKCQQHYELKEYLLEGGPPKEKPEPEPVAVAADSDEAPPVKPRRRRKVEE